GEIVAVGTSEEMRNRYADADEVDLGGKTVMPGIVEGHGHVLNLGQSFLRLNVEGVPSPAEVAALVEERVDAARPGEWIIGWGWDEGAWAKDYPTRAELDRVSPENPVYLEGLHGFASWVNGRVLEIAGITAETPDPPNGEIIKDRRTGEPTGILTNKAQDLFHPYIPPLTLEQRKRAFTRALEECVKYGITTVHDANTTAGMLEALLSMEENGELLIPVHAWLDGTDDELVSKYLERGPKYGKSEMLTIRVVKIFVDGALGSRGAVMFDDYSDAPGVRGVLVTTEDELYDITVRSLKAGFQVASHAIGDRANRITIDAFKRAVRDVPSARDHRLRIEHAQVMRHEDIPEFTGSGFILSMQPPHATSDMPWAETRVGPERVKGAYAWRSVLDTGVHFTLNSDFPGETLDPFRGMYAAETRKSPAGDPPGGWYAEQTLTRDEVLKAYTIEAAYSGYEENYKGKIAPGYLADFIVLSGDILTASPEELLSIEVEKTYVWGRPVYSK
ncbi:amidohydrolase, partial [candidate division KSB1 bacterium]